MYYTTTDQGIGCGGNLTSFNGTLTSPMYPEKFVQKESTKKECIWRLHSLGQHQLTVRFDYFDFDSNERCNLNYLEVYDGESMTNETYVKKFCGQVSCT